jgi:hypothetical protein
VAFAGFRFTEVIVGASGPRLLRTAFAVPGGPAGAAPGTVDAGRKGCKVVADAGGSVVVVVPGGHEVGGGITTVGTGNRSSTFLRAGFPGTIVVGSSPETRAFPIACSSIGWEYTGRPSPPPPASW